MFPQPQFTRSDSVKLRLEKFRLSVVLCQRPIFLTEIFLFGCSPRRERSLRPKCMHIHCGSKRVKQRRNAPNRKNLKENGPSLEDPFLFSLGVTLSLANAGTDPRMSAVKEEAKEKVI